MVEQSFGIKKTILYSSIITIVFLLLLEFGLRIYVSFAVDAEQGKALPTPAQRNAYQQTDPILGYSLIPGYKADKMNINTLGFRGREISSSKPDGITRIISVGDSTTFGLYGES